MIRVLKTAGIMSAPLGLMVFGIYNLTAFVVFLACLAVAIASAATWLHLKEIGQ